MLSVQLSLSEEAEAKLTLMAMADVTVFYGYAPNDEIEIHVVGYIGGYPISNCYFTNPTSEEGINQAFEYYLGSRELHEHKK